MYKKKFYRDEIDQQVSREMQRDIKLAKAKQIGKERRKVEKQAELDKRNSLYITNLPNNLQNITNKNSK